MLRSSRAFLGGGGFLGLWAAPGDICRDISLLVKAASSFIPKYYCFQKSERYRRPRRGSRREAGPHHGHHGSSRCSRLHRDKRKREVGLNFWQCVCVLCVHTSVVWWCRGHPDGLIVHHLPVMSMLLRGHYWSRLDWWSYHAEAGVHPHIMRNTNGCGLRGMETRRRRRKWDVTALALMIHEQHASKTRKNKNQAHTQKTCGRGDDTTMGSLRTTNQDKQDATKALI